MVLSVNAGVSAILSTPALRDGFYEYELLSPAMENHGDEDSQIIKRNILTNKSEVIYQGSLWPTMYANSKYIVVPDGEQFLRLDKKTYEVVFVPMDCPRNNYSYNPFLMTEKFFIYKNETNVYLVELDTLEVTVVENVFFEDGMYGGYNNDILEELYLDGNILLIQTGLLAYSDESSPTIEYNIETKTVTRHETLVVPLHKIENTDKVWYYKQNADESTSLVIADASLDQETIIDTVDMRMDAEYTHLAIQHLYSDESSVYYSILRHNYTDPAIKVVKSNLDGTQKEVVFDDIDWHYTAVYGNKIIISTWIPSLITYFDTNFTVETYEKIKKDIVLKIGSPDAIVGGNHMAIDADNLFVQPFIENEKTLLPIRFIAENLDIDVSWDQKNQMVTLKKGSTVITTKIGEKVININGIGRPLECAGIIANDRTMLPVRDVAEAFGLNVFWDNGLIILTNNDEEEYTSETMIIELKSSFWSLRKNSVTYVSY